MKFEKNQKVARVMKRYNPQLGVYHRVEEVTVAKITKKNYIVIGHSSEKYDIETLRRTDKTTSVYGSSEYFITSLEDGEQYG